VRGRDLVARCPVCLYAGSLVPREIVALAPAGARVIDTAPMDLDAIEAEFVAADERGEDVARLHSEICRSLARWVNNYGVCADAALRTRSPRVFQRLRRALPRSAKS